tara:strand:- start:123 stop:1202 length:1080 start_codon:yes stop_codon:yes gene_type:complete
MNITNKIKHSKKLYIFFLILSLIIFFFSTAKTNSKAFEVSDINISKPFEINFDKNEVLNEGFKKAFFALISLIVNSQDQKKIDKIQLNEIKGMIETFSIKEESFIDEIYNVNLGVSFNKKKVSKYLERKNIFPSIPIKNKFLFIPVIIDESKNDLLVFNQNKIYFKWNDNTNSHHLIEYILPTEDLEDLNLIKKNYDRIEQYDFKEIINKYDLSDSIVVLIFKNENDIRVLSRITIKENTILKNESFQKIDFDKQDELNYMINSLKNTYEDYWKNTNQINTSIKLPLIIKIDSKNNSKISDLEQILNKIDLIYDFSISKFDKEFVYYQIIFNGTPNIFLKTMKNFNFNFDTQNKIWQVK